jgi:hypothetical protein
MAEGLVGGAGFAVDASIITADAHRQRGVDGAGELNPAASRAVAEYLAVLDDAAFGAATDVKPKFTSPVDPAARWTAPAMDQPSTPMPTTTSSTSNAPSSSTSSRPPRCARRR